jgi:hypothetical protein
VATQYPLQSKAFTWPLSALHLLSRIPHSALYIRARVPATPFTTIVGDDKTIKSHDKPIKHLPCSPISMRLPEHLFFNLNTQITVANDNEWRVIA